MPHIKSIIHNKAHYFDELKKILRQRVWTPINYCCALWWSIQIGKGCRFTGKTYFKRVQNTSIKIGENCIFLSSKRSNLVGLYCPCIISAEQKNARIEIGKNCGFSGTRIWATKKIIIGNNVRCGANSYITDTDAHNDDYRAGKDSEVIIDDNVWIGMNVIVLKGVHIGENSVIGAGSIVTKNIPKNVIAAGNPCKIIKNIS